MLCGSSRLEGEGRRKKGSDEGDKRDKGAGERREVRNSSRRRKRGSEGAGVEGGGEIGGDRVYRRIKEGMRKG